MTQTSEKQKPQHDTESKTADSQNMTSHFEQDCAKHT